MEPGAVMKEAKMHMISRPSDEEYYVSETEIATRVTRYTEFENVKHNERGPDIHESEWGGTEDCRIIARWCKRDVAILHTKIRSRNGGTIHIQRDRGENHTPHGRMWIDRRNPTGKKLYLSNI
jgi:hypothetical protein